ncbi:MAG: hypothetical protein P4L40_24550 [Terracidiphilus sp.]|nr:hypothetical protein [Terracidiphilus sp.]
MSIGDVGGQIGARFAFHGVDAVSIVHPSHAPDLGVEGTVRDPQPRGGTLADFLHVAAPPLSDLIPTPPAVVLCLDMAQHWKADEGESLRAASALTELAPAMIIFSAPTPGEGALRTGVPFPHEASIRDWAAAFRAQGYRFDLIATVALRNELIEATKDDLRLLFVAKNIAVFASCDNSVGDGLDTAILAREDEFMAREASTIQWFTMTAVTVGSDCRFCLFETACPTSSCSLRIESRCCRCRCVYKLASGRWWVNGIKPCARRRLLAPTIKVCIYFATLSVGVLSPCVTERLPHAHYRVFICVAINKTTTIPLARQPQGKGGWPHWHYPAGQGAKAAKSEMKGESTAAIMVRRTAEAFTGAATSMRLLPTAVPLEKVDHVEEPVAM